MVVVTAIIIAAMASSAAPASHRPGPPALDPSFRIAGQDPGLRGGCRPAAVTARLAAALTAFNRGEPRGFAAAFDRHARFQPYGVRERLVPARFVRSRHRFSESWTAVDLFLPAGRLGHGVFGVGVRVTRAGDELFENGVKLIVDCRTGKFLTWLGPVPR
jgi:hypothetical protein